jgi:membrane protease YdiL (CAAX protease family)
VAVLPGTLEEPVFRGLIFGRLRASASLAWAVVISSVLFGLAHLSPDMALPNLLPVFLDTFVFGSLAALACWRTGSLYAAILAHVLSDTGPAPAVVMPHEVMGLVVTAEVSAVQACCRASSPSFDVRGCAGPYR